MQDYSGTIIGGIPNVASYDDCQEENYQNSDIFFKILKVKNSVVDTYRKK
jgi:hypothetical protein